MKILLINNYHYRFGGASVVYLNTSKLLQEHGHEVCFFSIKDEKNLKTTSEKYFIDRKVSVNDNTLNKTKNILNYFYNRQAAKNIEELIIKEKPDIAHIHLFYGGITSSILSTLKKYNIPIVHTAHDYRLICPAYTFLDVNGNICEQCNGKHFYKCTLKKCSKGNALQSFIMTSEMYFRNALFNPIKYIDGFCFVSEFSKNKHLKYIPNISSKLIEVLYNFEEELIIDSVEKDTYLLFFGRISDEKGIMTLLKTIINIPKICLKIVGSGPQEEYLKNFILSNNLKNVEFLGFKSGEELKTIISKAYFVIVPSEWYENNPMTIIEAYSCGTPVIGSLIGGIGEIIEDGKTGYTFESRDSIDLANKLNIAYSLTNNEYKILCKNAITFAALNFNKNNYLHRLTSFYLKIIEKNKYEKNNK